MIFPIFDTCVVPPLDSFSVYTLPESTPRVTSGYRHFKLRIYCTSFEFVTFRKWIQLFPQFLFILSAFNLQSSMVSQFATKLIRNVNHVHCKNWTDNDGSNHDLR